MLTVGLWGSVSNITSNNTLNSYWCSWGGQLWWLTWESALPKEVADVGMRFDLLHQLQLKQQPPQLRGKEVYEGGIKTQEEKKIEKRREGMCLTMECVVCVASSLSLRVLTATMERRALSGTIPSAFALNTFPNPPAPVRWRGRQIRNCYSLC